MSNLDKQVNQTIQRILSMIAPKGMSAAEKRTLAKSAGISIETLRTNLKRKTMNADTLVRLLIARGVSASTLENLPQTETAKLSRGELEWMELGRELSEADKKEFVSLIRYLLVRWELKDP